MNVKDTTSLFGKYRYEGLSRSNLRIRIIPNRRSFRKSCVHKNTVNPQFNEDFIFDVPPEQLTSCILQIILFDYNEYSRHECMGFVELPLEHIDLSEKVTLWKGLSPYDCQPEACGGELMISLCYLPSAQRLTVAVMKARNIGVKQAEDKSSIGGGMARAVMEGAVEARRGRPMGNWIRNLKEWSGEMENTLTRQAEDRALWRNSVRI
ncbi:Synaptotagmin-6 [Nymphon striatum]|nr:Synaptotagmin-6 [Nymphon striatum]